MVARPWVRLVTVGVAALSACKFSETVSAPPSQPFVVVQSVLNVAEPQQFVTVEAAQGGTTTGESGATVQLTHLNPGPGCTNPAVTLSEISRPQPATPATGVYMTQNLWCPLVAGDRVALRVETAHGIVVTGETRIPGLQQVQVQVGDRTTVMGGGSTVTLDRTRDSMKIAVSPVAARAMQVEVVRNDAGGYITFRFASDTTNLTVAGNLVDPFQDDGRTVFRAGARYLMTVAATDTNYFDFVRSGSDPFTGRGFINHLKGGVGVFGSVNPVRSFLEVVAPQSDPREGLYQLSGKLSGTDVQINWNLYRDVLTPQASGFSGFVDGTWLDGPTITSANAVIGLQPDPNLGPETFAGTIYGPPPASPDFPGQVGNAYQITGVRAAPGTPFPVVVVYRRNGVEKTDTLTAVQVRSP